MRWLAYVWAAPTSCLGLLCVVCTRSSVAVVGGVIEAHGPGLSWLFDLLAPHRDIAAMTLGHVVLGRDGDALDETRAHERIHVRQCERWGPLFVPAYLAASLLAWAAGGDIYLDNPFERQAFRDAPLDGVDG